MGRGDDPQIGAQGLASAHALERAVLQHAEQLRLHGRGELADLVQEQGAPVGGLDLADDAAIGAGERAALVAEQLALDERRGQRRAVHRDQRPVFAPRVGVDRAGEQALSDAGLAGEQHRGVGAGRAPHERVHLLEGRARADDPVDRAAEGDARAVGARGAQRGRVERLRHLGGERQAERLVLLVERAAALVEHLHDAADGVRIADGRGEQGARDVARGGVDGRVEPRVARRVADVHDLPALGHPPGDALATREPNFRDFR